MSTDLAVAGLVQSSSQKILVRGRFSNNCLERPAGQLEGPLVVEGLPAGGRLHQRRLSELMEPHHTGGRRMATVLRHLSDDGQAAEYQNYPFLLDLDNFGQHDLLYMQVQSCRVSAGWRQE